ncbi:hypothetical protein BC831DRAFT_434073 [Entophlyctis helioformis]|nr:hypothetical protein BC831DRAFT_434073 [Entophlyctis helioformis]
MADLCTAAYNGDVHLVEALVQVSRLNVNAACAWSARLGRCIDAANAASAPAPTPTPASASTTASTGLATAPTAQAGAAVDAHSSSSAAAAALPLQENGSDSDVYTTPPLHLAVIQGHYDVVQLLLDAGASLQRRDSRGRCRPALTAGCTGCSRSALVRCIYGSCDTLAVTSDNYYAVTKVTAAHLAIARLILRTLRKQTEASSAQQATAASASASASALGSAADATLSTAPVADVFEECVNGPQQGPLLRGITPLCLAAYLGKAEMVRTLIQNGARVDAPDLNGSTPLMYAARDGHAKTVEVLLFYHASATARDNYAWTAAQYATDYPDIVKLLANANVSNAASSDQAAKKRAGILPTSETLVSAIEAQRNPSSKPQGSKTQAGPVVLSHDDQYLLFSSIKDGDPDMLRSLLSSPVGPDATLFSDPLSGLTALQYAVRHRPLHVPDSGIMIKMLIEHGALVNARNTKTGKTPLHYITRDPLPVTAQPQQSGNGGSNSGADDAADTAAARAMVLDLVQVFLEGGADVHTGDASGNTPLHYACRSGDADLVRLLLKHGADMYATNRRGKTALDECQSADLKAIIERGQLLDMDNHIVASEGDAGPGDPLLAAQPMASVRSSAAGGVSASVAMYAPSAEPPSAPQSVAQSMIRASLQQLGQDRAASPAARAAAAATATADEPAPSTMSAMVKSIMAALLPASAIQPASSTLPSASQSYESMPQVPPTPVSGTEAGAPAVLSRPVSRFFGSDMHDGHASMQADDVTAASDRSLVEAIQQSLAAASDPMQDLPPSTVLKAFKDMLSESESRCQALEAHIESLTATQLDRDTRFQEQIRKLEQEALLAEARYEKVAKECQKLDRDCKEAVEKAEAAETSLVSLMVAYKKALDDSETLVNVIDERDERIAVMQRELAAIKSERASAVASESSRSDSVNAATKSGGADDAASVTTIKSVGSIGQGAAKSSSHASSGSDALPSHANTASLADAMALLDLKHDITRFNLETICEDIADARSRLQAFVPAARIWWQESDETCWTSLTNRSSSSWRTLSGVARSVIRHTSIGNISSISMGSVSQAGSGASTGSVSGMVGYGYRGRYSIGGKNNAQQQQQQQQQQMQRSAGRSMRFQTFHDLIQAVRLHQDATTTNSSNPSASSDSNPNNTVRAVILLPGPQPTRPQSHISSTGNTGKRNSSSDDQAQSSRQRQIRLDVPILCWLLSTSQHRMNIHARTLQRQRDTETSTLSRLDETQIKLQETTRHLRNAKRELTDLAGKFQRFEQEMVGLETKLEAVARDRVQEIQAIRELVSVLVGGSGGGQKRRDAGTGYRRLGNWDDSGSDRDGTAGQDQEQGGLVHAVKQLLSSMDAAALVRISQNMDAMDRGAMVAPNSATDGSGGDDQFDQLHRYATQALVVANLAVRRIKVYFERIAEVVQQTKETSDMDGDATNGQVVLASSDLQPTVPRSRQDASSTSSRDSKPLPIVPLSRLIIPTQSMMQSQFPTQSESSSQSPSQPQLSRQGQDDILGNMSPISPALDLSIWTDQPSQMSTYRTSYRRQPSYLPASRSHLQYEMMAQPAASDGSPNSPFHLQQDEMRDAPTAACLAHVPDDSNDSAFSPIAMVNQSIADLRRGQAVSMRYDGGPSSTRNAAAETRADAPSIPSNAGREGEGEGGGSNNSSQQQAEAPSAGGLTSSGKVQEYLDALETIKAQMAREQQQPGGMPRSRRSEYRDTVRKLIAALKEDEGGSGSNGPSTLSAVPPSVLVSAAIGGGGSGGGGSGGEAKEETSGVTTLVSPRSAVESDQGDETPTTASAVGGHENLRFPADAKPQQTGTMPESAPDTHIPVHHHRLALASAPARRKFPDRRAAVTLDKLAEAAASVNMPPSPPPPSQLGTTGMDEGTRTLAVASPTSPMPHHQQQHHQQAADTASPSIQHDTGEEGVSALVPMAVPVAAAITPGAGAGPVSARRRGMPLVITTVMGGTATASPVDETAAMQGHVEPGGGHPHSAGSALASPRSPIIDDESLRKTDQVHGALLARLRKGRLAR